MSKISVTKVASPVSIDAALPQDPNLRAVADDMLAKLRYSFTAAAAEENLAVSSSLDKLFREFLATRSSSTRTRAREKARMIMESEPQLRQHHFGRYAAIGLKEYRTLGADGLDGRVSALKVNTTALKKGLEKLSTRLSATPAQASHLTSSQGAPTIAAASLHPHNHDLAAGLLFKKLRLIIREVRCKEETDGPGSDEISMGGSIVGATGNTAIVNQFQVSNDFDEDEKRNPNRVFGSWTLRTAPQGFPYVYTAVVVMAEKDDGGFYKFLKELWEKLGDKVQEAIAGLVGASIGGALGAIAGPIGAIVGSVFGALIGFFLSLVDNPDDILGVKTMQLGLGACTKSYYDWAKLTAPQGLKNTIVFKGDGGRYEVDLSWKVVTQ